MTAKTLFITGASRGIGKAIALKAAAAGCNVAIAAKTTEPHPLLPGTIFSAAEEIEKAGGKALALEVDVRFEDQVAKAIEHTVTMFGGIDILINNASAISLTNTAETTMKKFDLMHQVNCRGTYLCSKLCLPYLTKSSNAHILTMAPPLNLNPRWAAQYLAYTLSKYGMSLCVLGLAEEFKNQNIAVNALWPKYLIATAATYMLAQALPEGGIKLNALRRPEIMADAAWEILNRHSSECSGNFFIDEEVLCECGKTDLSIYSIDKEEPPIADLFLDP